MSNVIVIVPVEDVFEDGDHEGHVHEDGCGGEQRASQVFCIQ